MSQMIKEKAAVGQWKCLEVVFQEQILESKIFEVEHFQMMRRCMGSPPGSVG